MRKLIIIILVLLICGCQQNTQTTDFKQTVPDTTCFHSKYDYKELKWSSEQIGLNTNYKDIDSFELRIWIDFTVMRTPQTLFIIKKTHDNWICLRYLNYYKYLDNYDAIIEKDSLEVPFEMYKVVELTTSKIENCGKPKSGWKSLIKAINIDNLLQIENQEQTNKYKNRYNDEKRCDADDGIAYSIELITKNEYKYILYHCPKFYSKCLDCKQSEFIANFIDLLYNEFDKFKEMIFIETGEDMELDYRC